MTQCIPILLLAVFSSSTTSQSRVWIVDDDATADFTEIYQAVAAAADGDTVLVNAGTYDGFAITGKSLTVQARSPAVPVVGEGVVVRDLAPGASVVLRGLHLVYAELVIEDCAGSVWVEDCDAESLDDDFQHVIRNSADVVVSRCSISADNYLQGLVVVDSSVHLFDSELRGADGRPASDIPCLMIDAQDGYAGLAVTGSFVYLSGCEVKGGDGGMAVFMQFCGCGDAGDGGSAVDLVAGNPTLVYRDSTFTSGAPGAGSPPCPAGGAEPPIQVLSGTATKLIDAARSFTASSPLAAGSAVTLDFVGVPGDLVYLLFGTQANAFYLPSCYGSVTVDLSSFVIAFVGMIPGSGTLSVAPLIPSIGPGAESLVLYAQANFVAPGVSCHVSSPSAVVITQHCQGSGLDCNGNGVTDECDLAKGTSADCNANGTPDECDIAAGASADCDANGIPDECPALFTVSSPTLAPFDVTASQGYTFTGLPQAAGPVTLTVRAKSDTNFTLLFDLSVQVNTAEVGVPFPSQAFDCGDPAREGKVVLSAAEWAALVDAGVAVVNMPGSSSGPACASSFLELELSYAVDDDCNGNGIPDSCDIASGTAADLNGNGIPDDCLADGDCNGNRIPDILDVLGGATDCDGNLVPDACQLALPAPGFALCTDSCADAPRIDVGQVYYGLVDGTQDGGSECSSDGPDVWYLYIPRADGHATIKTTGFAVGWSPVFYHGSCPPSFFTCPSFTPIDVLAGVPYYIRIQSDWVGSGETGIALLELTGPPAVSNDCNNNGLLDACEIASGASLDLNGNGIPDECVGG